MEDQYLASTNDVKCQNITIESIETLGGDVETILLTIIKELIIKDDITNGSFTLFDWSQLNAKGVWTFADWDNTTDKIIFMEIQPNGMFEFRTIDGSDLFSYQEYSQYIELMTNSRTKKKVENLEGLIISDTQNINKILRTDEITIPNLEKIQNIINEVEELFPESLRIGEHWANYIQSFVDQNCTQTNINDFSKVVNFIEKLREVGGNEIDKNSFRRLLNDSLGKNSNVTELFREHLLSDKNIRLIFSKNEENLKELFSSSLHINYLRETKTEALYFTGNKGINKYTINHACSLRQIIAVNESELIFKELLPTMDVDFVRTSQSTVIPFPFKYIREYKRGKFS